MVILVTGATGHVGRNLVRALLDRGARVRVLLYGSDVGLEGLPVERHRGDVLDLDSLRTAMCGVRVVYHLAGHIALVDDDPAVWRVNIDGVRNTARAAREAGVQRFVHFSSVHAYRFAGPERIVCEATPMRGHPSDPPYDRSKAAGERVLRAQIARGLPAVILNPTGILGPHDDGSHLGRGLLQAFGGLGLALPTGGFDWVDVRDVVATAIAASERGRIGENYIVSGHWRSVRDLSALASRIAGYRLCPATLPRSVSRGIADAAQRVAKATGRPPAVTRLGLRTLEEGAPVDGTKAQVELGHTARPLEATVADTYRWYVESGQIRDGRLARLQRRLRLRTDTAL